MSDYWLQLRSGTEFDYVDTTPEMILIEDIAGGLSKACRYARQGEKFLSVAEHCVEMSYMVSHELALTALLHDAAEAYIGDIPSPLKWLWGDGVTEVENRIMKIVAEKFGIIWPMPDEVRQADFDVRGRELLAMFKHPLPRWKDFAGPAVLPLALRFNPDFIEVDFRSRARELGIAMAPNWWKDGCLI